MVEDVWARSAVEALLDLCETGAEGGREKEIESLMQRDNRRKREIRRDR
jgi:hypothetical protein